MVINISNFESFTLKNIGESNILAIVFKTEIGVKRFLENTKESCFVSPINPKEFWVIPDEFLDDCENAHFNIIDPQDFIDNL